MKRCIHLFLFLWVGFYSTVFSQNIGQGRYFLTKQQLSDQEQFSGLMTFAEGVTIGDVPTAEISLNNSVFLNGPIAFSYDSKNTATLKLNSDVVLGGQVIFTTPALVNGQGNALLMSSDLCLNNRFAIQGSLVINGQGNTLTIGNGGFFDLLSVDDTKDFVLTSTLKLKNMTLVIDVQDSIRNTYCSSGKQYSFEDDVEYAQQSMLPANAIGTLELDNVNIVLLNDVWLHGYLAIKRRVSIFGAGRKFCVAPYVPCTGVDYGSLLYVGPLVDFVYRGSERTFFPCDASSMIWFDNTQIIVVGGDSLQEKHDGCGWKLDKGTVFLSNAIKINNCVGLNEDEPIEDAERSFELGANNSDEVNFVIAPNTQIDVLGFLYHNPL